MKNLAIIPARSGSKGLPDKNIMDLCGNPLMYYTIKAAVDSKCFDEVMVSTDSETYADIARACGASVPFLRSDFNSSDGASSWDTVREVLEKYKKLGKEYDYVALLQPTSPLRTSDDVKAAFALLSRGGVRNVVSVCEVDHPVQWCFTLPITNSMEEMAKSPYSYMRRQDLETHYRENGAIYIVSCKNIIDENYNLYSDNCYAYVMSKEKSIDIDDRLDLEIAKVMKKA